MSAEVPKLHRRLSLTDPAIAGTRPSTEVLVVLAEPTAFLPPRTLAAKRDETAVIDDRTMAFEAVGRFEYV